MAATVTVALCKINNRALGGLVAEVSTDTTIGAAEDMGDLSTQQVSDLVGPAGADGLANNFWRVTVAGSAIRFAFSATDPALDGATGELLGVGQWFFSATEGAKLWAIDAALN